MRRFFYEAAHWLFVGPAQRYGLPKPKYHFDEAHQTMSDEIPRLVAHGRLTVKPNIARFSGNHVVVGDGTEEAVDLVVFATGYKPAFPFFETEPSPDEEGHCVLHLNVFHPKHAMLFAAGLSQANGSMWRIADYQARLIARYIAAVDKAPEMARWFRAHIASALTRANERWFVPSARHALEVNFYEYQRLARRLIRHFDKRIPVPSKCEIEGASIGGQRISETGEVAASSRIGH